MCAPQICTQTWTVKRSLFSRLGGDLNAEKKGKRCARILCLCVTGRRSVRQSAAWKKTGDRGKERNGNANFLHLGFTRGKNGRRGKVAKGKIGWGHPGLEYYCWLKTDILLVVLLSDAIITHRTRGTRTENRKPLLKMQSRESRSKVSFPLPFILRHLCDFMPFAKFQFAALWPFYSRDASRPPFIASSV